MQAKKRYFLLTTSGIVILLLYFSLNRNPKSSFHNGESKLNFRSYVDGGENTVFPKDLHVSPEHRRTEVSQTNKKRCRMETCFDFSVCKNGFKVYVYPLDDRVSTSYSKIITTIQESKYSTQEPTEACIFVLSIDTLDRDTLGPDYTKDVQSKINNLPLWNNGKNHIVFNLYSGTWPDYVEHLGFETGEAILAKASMSVNRFRPGFDISFPLFPKDHPMKGGEKGYIYVSTNNIPPTRYFLLGFKGKRYLTGKGSETRNSLYHVHNGKDVILLTTCRHGKDWQRVARELNDTRCETDNKEYDK